MIQNLYTTEHLASVRLLRKFSGPEHHLERLKELKFEIFLMIESQTHNHSILKYFLSSSRFFIITIPHYQLLIHEIYYCFYLVKNKTFATATLFLLRRTYDCFYYVRFVCFLLCEKYVSFSPYDIWLPQL